MAAPNNNNNPIPPTPPGQLYPRSQIPNDKLVCAGCKNTMVVGQFQPIYCWICSSKRCYQNHVTGWIYVHDYELELLNLLRPMSLQHLAISRIKHDMNEEIMRRLNIDERSAPIQHATPAITENATTGNMIGWIDEEKPPAPYREHESDSDSGDSFSSKVSADVCHYLNDEWDEL
jgi:hypothetical protein